MKMLLRGIAELQDPYYQNVPAELAFFLFMSFLPMMMIIFQLVGIFSLTAESLRAWAGLVAQDSQLGYVNAILSYEPSRTFSVFLVVIALWFASKAQFALARVSDYVFTGEAESYIRVRIRSTVATLIILASIALALAVLVYSPAFMRLLFGQSRELEMIESLLFRMRWPLGFIVLVVILSYFYYWMPSKMLPYRTFIPGSVFAAVGIVAVSFVYNLFARKSILANLIYGSLSHIVVMLVWFWLVAWVLCLGILINKLWLDTKQDAR